MSVTNFSLGPVAATIDVDDPTSDSNAGECTMSLSAPASRVSTQGLNRIATDLCWLLSLATNSMMSAYQFPTETGTRSISVDGWINPAFSHIPVLPGRDIRTFVETTWSNFRRHVRGRKLVIPIHYLLLADVPHQPMEISALLTFVAWESLKHTWALKAGIPFKKGFFRTPSGNAIGFTTLSRRMLVSVGLHSGVERLAKLRNRIVHTGLGAVSYPQLERQTTQTRILLLRYMFRLLGYVGSFHRGALTAHT